MSARGVEPKFRQLCSDDLLAAAWIAAAQRLLLSSRRSADSDYLLLSLAKCLLHCYRQLLSKMEWHLSNYMVFT